MSRRGCTPDQKCGVAIPASPQSAGPRSPARAAAGTSGRSAPVGPASACGTSISACPGAAERRRRARHAPDQGAVIRRIISPAVTTSANSPARFASDISCTCSGAWVCPSIPTCSNVQVALRTTFVSNPRLPAIRTVVSTQWFVVAPTITSDLIAESHSRRSRSVPIKALLFDDHRLPRQFARRVLHLKSRKMGSKCRLLAQRGMTDVEDGRATGATMFDQSGNLGEGIGVIAPTSTRLESR